MSKIGSKGGMSLSTGFDVKFQFGPNVKMPQRYYFGDDKDILHMLCDEAQLPNVQASTAQITGRYLGETAMQYPTSRLYTDVGLGFLCDAELIPLKFFTYWYDYIFGETDNVRGDVNSNSGDYYGAMVASPNDINRINRLNYLDDYVATCYIVKTESGPRASNQRAPITFMLENCYPYAVDAVPLAYGTSQVARVNVNLYYSRHTVSYGDGVWKKRMLSQAQQDTGNAVLANANSNIA